MYLLSIHLAICLSAYLSTLSLYLPAYLPTFRVLYPSICPYADLYLSIYLSIYIYIYYMYLSLSLSLSLPISFSILCLSMCLFCLSTYLSVSLSLSLSLAPSLSLTLPISVFVCISPPIPIPTPIHCTYLPIYPSIHLSVWLSEKKQFCAASFKSGSCRSKTILRDFLKNGCSQLHSEEILRDFPSKVACRADSLVPISFLLFAAHASKVLCPSRKSEAKSYEVPRHAAPVMRYDHRKFETFPFRKCEPSQEISALTSQHVWRRCPLYRACHAKCIFADLVQTSQACHCFWNCHKTFALSLYTFRVFQSHNTEKHSVLLLF